MDGDPCAAIECEDQPIGDLGDPMERLWRVEGSVSVAAILKAEFLGRAI